MGLAPRLSHFIQSILDPSLSEADNYTCFEIVFLKLSFPLKKFFKDVMWVSELESRPKGQLEMWKFMYYLSVPMKLIKLTIFVLQLFFILR